MPLLENERGQRWCVFPRPFRLREQLEAWLFDHGAYVFDRDHYVIDDPNSPSCLYIQVGETTDGRYNFSFVVSREHWPEYVPRQACRMRSASEIMQQTQQTLSIIGGAVLAAALMAPKVSHIYHHRSR